jgi:hypothetical protein
MINIQLILHNNLNYNSKVVPVITLVPSVRKYQSIFMIYGGLNSNKRSLNQSTKMYLQFV